jgi:hypothetical protein
MRCAPSVRVLLARSGGLPSGLRTRCRLLSVRAGLHRRRCLLWRHPSRRRMQRTGHPGLLLRFRLLTDRVARQSIAASSGGPPSSVGTHLHVLARSGIPGIQGVCRQAPLPHPAPPSERDARATNIQVHIRMAGLRSTALRREPMLSAARVGRRTPRARHGTSAAPCVPARARRRSRPRAGLCRDRLACRK